MRIGKKAERKTAPRRPKSKRRSATSASRALARPGDPLVTSSGTLIPAELNAEETHAKARVHKVTPASFRPQTRRALRDMPAQGNQLKGIAIVLVYSIMGLSDRDIADTLEVDIDMVRRIRTHSAYEEVFTGLYGEFINANSDMLQARIAAYSEAALTQVATIAVSGVKEENRMKSSIDLLSREERIRSQGVGGPKKGSTLRIIVEAADTEQGVSISLDDAPLESNYG